MRAQCHFYIPFLTHLFYLAVSCVVSFYNKLIIQYIKCFPEFCEDSNKLSNPRSGLWNLQFIGIQSEV